MARKEEVMVELEIETLTRRLDRVLRAPDGVSSAVLPSQYVGRRRGDDMTPREFKRLRKEAGFTLRQLSAVMTVHKSTIVRWQSGRARIPEARARQVRQLHVEALKSQEKREGVMAVVRLSALTIGVRP